MAIIKWTYTLRMRTKNTAGTVLHTWIPQTSFASPSTSPWARPLRIGPPTYTPEFLDREMIDRSRRPHLVGWRAHLVLEWNVRAYAIGWESTGADTLYTLLNDLATTGSYLEVSLNNGTTYKRMNIVSSLDYTMPDGKAVSLGLTLELEGADIQTVLPNGVLMDGAW